MSVLARRHNCSDPGYSQTFIPWPGPGGSLFVQCKHSQAPPFIWWQLLKLQTQCLKGDNQFHQTGSLANPSFQSNSRYQKGYPMKLLLPKGETTFFQDGRKTKRSKGSRGRKAPPPCAACLGTSKLWPATSSRPCSIPPCNCGPGPSFCNSPVATAEDGEAQKASIYT